MGGKGKHAKSDDDGRKEQRFCNFQDSFSLSSGNDNGHFIRREFFRAEGKMNGVLNFIEEFFLKKRKIWGSLSLVRRNPEM